MRSLPLIVVPALAFLTQAMAAAAPPVVTAIRTAQSPVLDGGLDDAVWRQGEWCNNFTLLGEGSKPAPVQTRFKVAFDLQNLYFGVELFEPQMDMLVARETRRDGRVHADDALEIMVVPNSARLDYYHFSVNALGTRYDAEMRQGGNVRATEWNANWQAKIAKGTQSWTVEIAIPFVELGLTGLSRGDWALNVARERQGDHLFLVNHEGEQHMSLHGQVGYPFFGQLILDCLNRTEEAQTQEHAFKAVELCVKCQMMAVKVE